MSNDWIKWNGGERSVDASTIVDVSFGVVSEGPKPENDGWIEWKGGERPVPPDALIQVRYRDGSTNSGLAWEWNLKWSHRDGPTDIVAYRVLRKAPAAKNDGVMNYWIGWRGGERPVPHDTLVGVLFRSGQTAVGPCSEFGWQHSKSVIQAHADSDIIAYYVVSEPAKPEEPAPDMVNSPPHYTDGGIEAIDYIEAKLGPDGFKAYCVGNALKYISRAGKKGSAKEDLSKAIWYLRRAGGG